MKPPSYTSERYAILFVSPKMRGAHVLDRFGNGAVERVVENRKIVRREVPQDVDVGLEQAEIRSHRVVIERTAEVFGDHDFAKLANGRIVDERVIDENLSTARIRHAPQLRGLGRSRAQGLFYEYVLPGEHGLFGEFEVGGDRRRNNDEIYVRVGAHDVNFARSRRPPGSVVRQDRAAPSSCRRS